MSTTNRNPKSLFGTLAIAVLCAGTLGFARPAAAHSGAGEDAEAPGFIEPAGFIRSVLGHIGISQQPLDVSMTLTPVQVNPAAGFINRMLSHMERSDEREFVGVTLYDENARSYSFFVLPIDGELSDAQQAQVSEFFHCRRTGKQRKMHQGVIAMLADVAKAYPGQVIEVISAYRGMRSESRTSPHRAGRAIDIRVRGTKTTELRDYLWTHHSHVGIGYYAHEGYVHMDTRPKENDISWTQRRKGESYRYNPSWATRARDKAADRKQAQDGKRS